MNINVNEEEAKLLVASADRDGSNNLDMKEFMDLIFT